MSQPLIIIDAQHQFLDTDHYNNCIKGIIKQIKLAKRRNDYIIFVEYVNSRKRIINKQPSSDPTIQSILSQVSNYKKVLYVYKVDDNGGREVVHTLRKKRIPRSNVRVCGAYASFCVAQTTDVMAKKLKRSKILLMKKAITCYEDNYRDKLNALTQLTFEHENVFIRN